MFKSLLKIFGRKHLDETARREVASFGYSIPRKLTSKIFDELPDDRLGQAVFVSTCQNVSNNDNDEYRRVMNLNKPQQAVHIIWILEAEVNNGGFNQFYWNSSGQFAHLTPEMLRHIGAVKLAELVERANKIYEEEVPKPIERTIEAFSKSYENNPLNNLDDEFFELYKVENLEQMLTDFIKKNKLHFIRKN